MDSGPEAPLDARSLTRIHPNGLGVHGIDLRVAAGEIVGLVGANGAGKTTLLRVLATANPPTSGAISWFGRSARRDPEVRRRLGVMLDAAVHLGRLSGWRNALFFAHAYGLRGVRAERRLTDLFEWAGIAGARHLPVDEYSLGMRRRLGLVEALAHRPPLLVLDEPSLALDQGGEIDLEAVLLESAAGGAAAVVATNDPRLVRVCHRVLHLENGRLAGGAEAA